MVVMFSVLKASPFGFYTPGMSEILSCFPFSWTHVVEQLVLEDAMKWLKFEPATLHDKNIVHTTPPHPLTWNTLNHFLLSAFNWLCSCLIWFSVDFVCEFLLVLFTACRQKSWSRLKCWQCSTMTFLMIHLLQLTAPETPEQRDRLSMLLFLRIDLMNSLMLIL